jgi:hypothetical protein
VSPYTGPPAWYGIHTRRTNKIIQALIKQHGGIGPWIFLNMCYFSMNS